MRRYTIYGKKPQPISALSRSIIILNRGRATITLNPDGVVTTFSTNVSEGTIKRDSKYKSALYDMSEQMMQAYEAQTFAYLQLHRKLKKTIYSKKSYESKIEKIVKKTYKRRTFNVSMPTTNDVMELLKNEAESVFYSKSDKSSSEINKYINERLSKLHQDRLAKWQEAKDLFNDIEDAREQKINAQYQKEYDAERNNELNFVNGTPDKVEEAIDMMVKELDVPFNFDFQYSYSQSIGTLDVDVELRNGVDLPKQKAEMLSSGKVTIKNKLMREISQQTTETIFSFVFYFAGRLFSTSPNIDHVRLSIWEAGKQEGLLWVDFNRTNFARNISPSMVPLTDIQVFHYPNVYDLRTRNSAMELNPIDAFKFQKRIKEILCVVGIEYEKKNTEPVQFIQQVESKFEDEQQFDLEKELQKLINNQEYLSAIKTYKEAKGISLKEAKEYVDMLRNEQWKRDEDFNRKVFGKKIYDRDPLFEEIARQIVTRSVTSTGSIQRNFNIGYNRAGRIMDQLEAAGIVGPAPAIGVGSRKVLMSPSDLERLLD